MKYLNGRQQSILNRVIDTYIETAQPVGSKTITGAYREQYNASFSPATVRMEMNNLEEKGYLSHPHTSSGRIPTDRGYRYYVDHCVCRENFPQDIFEPLAAGSPACSEMDVWIDKASKLLSGLTEELSIIALPDPESGYGTSSGQYKVFLQGMTRLLEKPEFQDVGKVRILFEFLEEKIKLIPWLIGHVTGGEFSVTIGRENAEEVLRDCAVVSSCFSANGQARGIIAVLGPKRMRYSRTLPLVDHMGDLVERILEMRSTQSS